MNKYLSRKLNKNYWLIKKTPILNKIARAWLLKNNIQNLILLKQILSKTKFAEKYWLIGGLLLGWIRERDFLKGNENDIDFAFNYLDEHFFLEVIPLLNDFGFQSYTKWKNNAGQITEYVLLKDGCKYEFFLMFEEKEFFKYYGYSKSKKGLNKNQILEAIGEIKKHDLISMNIFDIPILVPEKPKDWLTERYGDWEIPISDYNFMDGELTIINRTVWKGNNRWD